MQKSKVAGAGHGLPSLPLMMITIHFAQLWNGADELINTISHKETVPVGKMELPELSVSVPCAAFMSRDPNCMIKNDKC